MKSLILATDIIKTPAGEYKVLEINTNALLGQPFNTETHNLNSLIPFLQSNGFESVHAILPRTSVKFFGAAIKEACEGLGITYVEYQTANDAVTVPYIEDDTSKLILRVAYDTTAIIDDDYARDKFKFQTVINNKAYACKTYIPNEIDNFENISEFSYTENKPNFIVKKRYPNYDREEWPKLYKIQNVSELNALKNSIDDDCFIQEYLDSGLIENKKFIIRTVDLLYGPNLDVLNICSFNRTNKLAENIWENTFDENGLLNKKDRFKYVSHALPDNFTNEDYVYDVDQDVVLADGTKKQFINVVIGDQVKAIHIEGLPILERNYDTYAWVGNYNDFVNNFNLTPSTVTNTIQSQPVDRLYLRITLNDGTQWDDIQGSTVLFKVGDTVRFKQMLDCKLGDEVIFVNFETTQPEVKVIQSMEVIYKENQILGSLDIEPIDVYLPLISERISLIQHNQCVSKFCRPACSNFTYCQDCAGSVCGEPQK